MREVGDHLTNRLQSLAEDHLHRFLCTCDHLLCVFPIALLGGGKLRGPTSGLIHGVGDFSLEAE